MSLIIVNWAALETSKFPEDINIGIRIQNAASKGESRNVDSKHGITLIVVWNNNIFQAKGSSNYKLSVNQIQSEDVFEHFFMIFTSEMRINKYKLSTVDVT